MADLKLIKRTVSLDGGSVSDPSPNAFFDGEQGAHTFIIAAMRGGEVYNFPGSATVSGTFLNPNDATVPLSGSVVDGCAVITLSNPCYELSGRFTLTIDVNGATIYECQSRVRRRSSSTVYDPSSEISVSVLIAEVNALRTEIAEAVAAIPADYSDLQSAVNYYGHPCIKEIYIFDTSYGAAMVNTITDSNGIRFANSSGTAVVASASASVRRYPVVPIIAGGGTKIGYVYVDWTKYSYAVVNHLLQDAAFDLQCSPILHAYISKSLFVENAPYIRELYITPGGVTADVSTVHIVYVASQHVVRFSNAAGNAFTGTATFDHQNPNHIAPIISNSNTVVGYLLMDWTLVNDDTTVIAPIKPIAQSLDYSPSIAAYLDNGVSGLSEQVSLLATDVSTLSGNLAAEQAARQAADTALGARIDNLVAPSGSSVAEIVDARTGANGTVYSTLEARLNAEYGMFNAKLNKIRTIGVGQQYQTVQAAVNAAANGDILLIYPGVYHEAVSITDKTLYLIGASRNDCVIEYENGDYDEPVVEMVKGVLKNLTLHAISQASQNPSYGKAYALHCDFQSWGITGGTLYCENVKFINDDYRSVGMGLRANGHNEFVNCEFTTLSGYEALYFHDVNVTQYGTENQSLSIKNCTFFANANSRPAISANTQETASKAASIEWQRNIVVNKGTGGLITMTFFQNRQPIDGNGWMGSSDWVLKETSALNTLATLNY